MSPTPSAAGPLTARASGHPARASPNITGDRDRHGPRPGPHRTRPVPPLDDRPLFIERVSVMLVSCGNPVQPAAEADEHAGGAEDVLDAVQQPAPAAQRPGACQVGDGLLHQRAQPRLATVVGALRVAEPVDGAAVPDRRVPVLTRLGHAPKPPVQQTDHAGGVQHPVKPRQLDELLLVAAGRPAHVAPQQVAPDGRYRQALGVWVCRLGSYSTFWLPHPLGRCTRVPSPSTTTALPVWAISSSSSRSSARVVTNVPSGWQYPSSASLGSSRSMLSPTSVLEIPTARPARRYDSPSRITAATASRRTSSDSGGLPPFPGGLGGSRWARRSASQAKACAGSEERGQYDNGDQTSRQA